MGCEVWTHQEDAAQSQLPASFNLAHPCFPDAASVRGRQLLAGLEKVNSDLEKQEKAITANLRPPLEQSRAVQDSAERSKDLKVQQGSSQGFSALVLNCWVLEALPEPSSTWSWNDASSGAGQQPFEKPKSLCLAPAW